MTQVTPDFSGGPAYADVAVFAQELHGSRNGTPSEAVLTFIKKGAPVKNHRLSDSTDIEHTPGSWPGDTMGWNSYMAVCRFDPDTDGRKAEQAVLIPGVWADLDIKPGKDDKPQNSEELSAIMAVLPEPTILIDSGLGNLQPYWLFPEMNGQPDACEKLLKRWHTYLNAQASHALGRTIKVDSVFDLARVLRIPGTWRWPKTADEHKAPVKLLKHGGPRYTPKELWAMSDVPEMPGEDRKTARARGERTRTSTPVKTPIGVSDEGVTEVAPDIKHPRIAAWVRAVVKDVVKVYSEIRVTGMNTGLNTAAITLGGLAGYGYTDRDEIYELLIEASIENGLLDADGNDGHNSRQQVDATFESGWNSGLEKPYDLPEWMGELKEQVTVNNPAIAAEWLRTELGQGELSGIFIKDTVLVHTPRIGEDGYVEPSPKEKAARINHGPAQVQTVDSEKVKAMVVVRYDVGKEAVDKDTNQPVWVPAFFPREAAQDAVNAALLGIGCPNVQILQGVTHTPLVRRSGSILDAPGYDMDTGLLYLPDRGLSVPEVPQTPTMADVRRAVALILKPVSEFPFVTENHRANWLGLMFTPLMRELLAPPYQMGIITAPNPGSGKGYLAGLIGIVHGMVMRGEMPREKAEMKKTIISSLISTTAPVVLFDNVRGEIYSSELEALLTAGTITDRLLGYSKDVTVTNDRLWMVTGNNAKIGGDLARRVLEVKIDPKCSDPKSRTFAIPDLMGWMEENRGEYLAAMLTVIRAWINAGKPVEVFRSDSFAQWAGALRGMLHWAKFPGTFGEVETEGLETVSEDDREWAVFLEALADCFGDSKFEAKAVVEALTAGGETWAKGQDIKIPVDALPGDLAEKWTASYTSRIGFTKSLGKWLGNRDGRFVMGLCIRKSQAGKHAATFTIERES
jgi:hypothetical protein